MYYPTGNYMDQKQSQNQDNVFIWSTGTMWGLCCLQLLINFTKEYYWIINPKCFAEYYDVAVKLTFDPLDKSHHHFVLLQMCEIRSVGLIIDLSLNIFFFGQGHFDFGPYHIVSQSENLSWVLRYSHKTLLKGHSHSSIWTWAYSDWLLATKFFLVYPWVQIWWHSVKNIDSRSNL